jgi:transaldolase / glucose-6-phosphate isomerase
MAENPLRQLNRLGQSVWYDYIRRGEIQSGHLKQLIDQDGLSGVTSNPSIFEKAIAGSKDYDQTIERLVQEDFPTPEIFERLAVEDIQSAADLFRPTYEATGGGDGFVSLEVSPTLARDTLGTIAEARRLFAEVNRPNVLIKIPGTKEGLPAIRQMLTEGVNINITLLFGVERYIEVAEAYLAALEARATQGKPVDRIASVASFFVSRIDTLVDQELGARIQAAKSDEERKKLEGLMGQTAIANAKRAYQEFKRLFTGPRFQALAAKRAKVQRVLWASTSTKNPKYRDVIYVEDLIGPHTINTMPGATMAAFRQHGQARVTIEEGLEDSRNLLQNVERAGISLVSVTQKLEDDGVAAFSNDFLKLLKVIEEKRSRILAALVDRWSYSAPALEPAIQATLTRLENENFTKRLWDHDPALWKSDPDHQKIIRNALGWLSVGQSMLEHIESVVTFAEEARRAGFKHAVLLGMGGSSLCPDVFRATFGSVPGYLALHVLDSTVPAAVEGLEKSLNLAETLFLVSSKSGGTAETLSFFRYFYEGVTKIKGSDAGSHFVAITDPGTSLEALAKEKKFRAVFHGYPDIDGRYSALSNFGMLPAALMGVDVRGLLERAERMVQASKSCVPVKENPGVALGVVLAEAARAGRDKITFSVSGSIGTLGNWLEQLMAESTGKEGKGLIPAVDMPLGTPSVYGDDRLFVQIKLADFSDSQEDAKLAALEKAGHPVVRITMGSKMDLGAEFYRWEVATATAGALMGIDAFDQPNVQESKDNTNRLLDEFRRQGKLPEPPADFETDGLRIFADSETRRVIAGPKDQATAGSELPSALRGFLGRVKPNGYIALMAYVEPSGRNKVLLKSIRLRLRDSLRQATTLGFGPRFLHSTGQLHKGGPDKGLFLQFTADDANDVAIPGEPFGFSILKQAQSLGDMQALVSRIRPVLRVHLGSSAEGGLERVLKALEQAVGAAEKARA